MSYRLNCPTHVYEIIPDQFVGATGDAATSPLRFIERKLDHIQSLGVDGIALTPLFPADDALRLHVTDFDRIDEKLGTMADLESLCRAAAERGISVTLMGVFDHVSSNHAWFRYAQQQQHDGGDGRFPPEQRTRAFFHFGVGRQGYACRDGSEHAPELDLRNAEVRRRLFTGEESVLHKWMHAGASGWRILRAEQVGYSILRELQRASRNIEGSHYMIGDIKGFADRYQRDGLLDAVVNHYAREGMLAYLKGEVPARQLARVERDLQKSYEKSLARSWSVLSSYDTPRTPTILGDQTPLAVFLGFTLPGAAHVLFGEEIGIAETHGLPASTSMVWDEAQWNAQTLARYRHLGALRRQLTALRVGEFVDMTPEGEGEVFAFARVTADPRETCIAVVNRSDRALVRKLFAPISDLVDGLHLKDALSDAQARVRSGALHLEIGKKSCMLFVPDDADEGRARFFRGY